MIDNKFVKLMKRPSGFPSKDTWSHDNEQVKAVKDGEILIKNLYVSLDPAMRGWLNETRSYIPPVKIGEVMRAGTIGEVIESKNSKFKKGDILSGWGGVQQYSISDGKGYFKVNPSQIPLQTYIGTLGMPGMTAYFGILEVGKIKEGDTVLVSAAAGAVGSIVGQIAKIKGCKVIGIAGGKEKCDYVIKELGFDGCIDYKNESVKRGIKRECPDGIDVYFDNVGGEILDSALVFLRMGARIVICGAISQYNEMSAKGPDNYLSLLVNRATMKGMVVFDYANKYPLATKEMTQWIIDGSLKSKEDIHDGIENFYEIFKKLFNGEKKGKLILKL
jgi:NADPH-dependent curcumin reductase CurA